MDYGNEVSSFSDGENNNLVLTGVIAAGTAVAAGVSYLMYQLGKNSAARKAIKYQWVAAESKKKREQIFGDDYEALSKLFSDLATNEPVNSDRNGKVKS